MIEFCRNCGWPAAAHDGKTSDSRTGEYSFSLDTCPAFSPETEDDRIDSEVWEI
jgi:hypothetical protein